MGKIGILAALLLLSASSAMAQGVRTADTETLPLQLGVGVTFLEETQSGLSWELDICERGNIPRLYVCHKSAAQRAAAALAAHRAALSPSDVVRVIHYDANGLPLGFIRAFVRSLDR